MRAGSGFWLGFSYGCIALIMFFGLLEKFDWQIAAVIGAIMAGAASSILWKLEKR